MTTDNRTNESSKIRQDDAKHFAYTPEQVEAAAKAIADCHNPGMFEKYPENWKVEARAALVAAAGAAPQAESGECGARHEGGMYICELTEPHDDFHESGTVMGATAWPVTARPATAVQQVSERDRAIRKFETVSAILKSAETAVSDAQRELALAVAALGGEG